MPTDSQTGTIDTHQLAEQLYDLLMGKIEEDLLIANIPSLDEKYAGESEQEKAARLKRYEAAYKKLDEAFAAFMGEVHSKARAQKSEALKQAEAEEKTKENTQLQSIESAFG